MSDAAGSTMDTVIELCRGPLFRFALALALLGLLRLALLSAWELRRALRRAGDRRLTLWPLVGRTLASLSPLRYLAGNRAFYTAASVLLHAGVLLVPAFYAGHVWLWRRGLGVGWPALPATLADGLVVMTLAAAALLLAGRAWSPTSRAVSRLQDWLLPVGIALASATGYLLAHPAANPLDLRLVTLVHVGSGDLLLALTPFTKLAHCALLPLSRLVNELAWRFVPGAGHAVTKTLGKEGQPI
jgi:nitrate reductase gamma subunit